jgi:two-component system phosphate regulon response regulator OmpR
MDAPRILIVDDDLRLRDLLERYLGGQGFQTRGVANAAGLRAALAAQHFDLIVLDLMLPDGDGLDVCRQLRAHGDTTPVIMLTARGDEIDRVVGLELGADDYLPKPCSPRELLARVRAVLRRAPEPPRAAPRAQGGRCAFGPYVLELDTRRLLRDGAPLKLTSGEFALLAALVAQPHQPLSRDRLLNLARGADFQAYDRSVDVMMSRLRKLIEDDPRQPRWLQTVRGAGYVFVPDGIAP